MGVRPSLLNIPFPVPTSQTNAECFSVAPRRLSFSKSKFSPRRCPSTPAAFQRFALALAPPPPGACALSPPWPLRGASCFASCSASPPSLGRAQGKGAQTFGTGQVRQQSSLVLAAHPRSETAPRLPGRGAWGVRSARPRLGYERHLPAGRGPGGEKKERWPQSF